MADILKHDHSIALLQGELIGRQANISYTDVVRTCMPTVIVQVGINDLCNAN